jgi:hypothetical protein
LGIRNRRGTASGLGFDPSGDEGSREIGDAAWAKLFASKDVAQKWIAQNAPKGKTWYIPSKSRRERLDRPI